MSQFYIQYIYIDSTESHSPPYFERGNNTTCFHQKILPPSTKLQVQGNTKKFISLEPLSCAGSPQYHETMQQVFFKNLLPNKTWNSSVT